MGLQGKTIIKIPSQKLSQLNVKSVPIGPECAVPENIHNNDNDNYHTHPKDGHNLEIPRGRGLSIAKCFQRK